MRVEGEQRRQAAAGVGEREQRVLGWHLEAIGGHAAYGTPVAVKVDLWTDGACSGNPGPGGWAAILVARREDGSTAKQVELSGGDPATTNNRMELQAVISGLMAIQKPSAVTIHIDSTYVMDAIAKRWIVGWQARGWKTAAKQPVKNADLWRALDEAAARVAHGVVEEGPRSRGRGAQRALRRAGGRGLRGRAPGVVAEGIEADGGEVTGA